MSVNQSYLQLKLSSTISDMPPPKVPGAKRGTVHGAAAQNLVRFTIRAAPVPPSIYEFLHDNLAILRRMRLERKAEGADANSVIEGEDAMASRDEDYDVQGDYIKKPTVKAEQFWDVLAGKCKAAGGEWADIVDKIWAFGPLRMGTCLLIDARSGKPNS